MPFIQPSRPHGTPAFQLSQDQIATIMDLLCRGAKKARPRLQKGMLEPEITKLVRQSMRREKLRLSLTNIEIHREYVVDASSQIEGRIDIVVRLPHQFGDEDAYVAVECKKLEANNSTLNGKYVTRGVGQFASGKYAKNHEVAFMMGYVLKLPIESILNYLDRRMRDVWGRTAAFTKEAKIPYALAVRSNKVLQCSVHEIRLTHVFVDMRLIGKNPRAHT